MDPVWGVIIGLGIGGLIKVLFFSGGRKAKKAATSGQCPTCGAAFVEKPFTTVTLRVCPEKHGYLSGNDEWINAKRVAKTAKPIKDMAFEDLPSGGGFIIFWTMYHELFGEGSIDTRPVDNVPKRKK